MGGFVNDKLKTRGREGMKVRRRRKRENYRGEVEGKLQYPVQER